jgi:choline dehydrogenase-like flavoprotein
MVDEAQQPDVVVVGSGMGGSTLAWALAGRGARVLVLERGERLPREPQNISPSEVFLRRRYKPAETWRDGAGRSFAPGVHYVVGGNTKVYGASLPRFRERDFEAVEHREGTSPARPLRYADLEPYYGRAEALYRVHGSSDVHDGGQDGGQDGGAGADPGAAWRSTPFPFPAMPHEPYIAALADRLRAAGVHPVDNAMGVDLREGGSCIRCATCDGFPCVYGAKSDAEVCALDPALASGLVELRTGARVRRVVARNGRVDHLVVETADGVQQVTSGAYVLSAGAVNSAALLLASHDETWPHGLANRSGMVGRHFMMHNNAHVAAVDLDRRNDVVFSKTLSVNDFYEDGGDGYPLGTLQLIGKVQGVMMKSWATTVPLPLLNALAARSVEWLVMTEDLPDPDNRVTVAGDGTVVTTRTARNTAPHRELHRRARSLLRACGYDAVFTQWFDISMNSHMCGTLRAGTDPATSVLDPWCRSHDLANLWCVDGGFFPSSAAMNPALTIAAQALRVAAESDLARG